MVILPTMFRPLLGLPAYFHEDEDRCLIIEEKILTKKTEDDQNCALRLKIASKMCGLHNFEDKILKISLLTLKI